MPGRSRTLTPRAKLEPRLPEAMSRPRALARDHETHGPRRRLETEVFAHRADRPADHIYRDDHHARGVARSNEVRRDGQSLPVRQHPFQEIDGRLFLGGVVDLVRNQEPGEGRDGIGVLARRVGDGDTIIGRYRFQKPFGRRGNRVQGWLDKISGLVLYGSVGKAIVFGKN